MLILELARRALRSAYFIFPVIFACFWLALFHSWAVENQLREELTNEREALADEQAHSRALKDDLDIERQSAIHTRSLRKMRSLPLRSWISSIPTE